MLEYFFFLNEKFNGNLCAQRARMVRVWEKSCDIFNVYIFYIILNIISKYKIGR